MSKGPINASVTNKNFLATMCQALRFVLFPSQRESSQHACTQRKPFSSVGPVNTPRPCRCLFTRSETPRLQRPSAAGLPRAETHSSGRPCCSPCSRSTCAQRISPALLWICSMTTHRSLRERGSSSSCLTPGLFSWSLSFLLAPSERPCTRGGWHGYRRH